ncbi:hypothetical protein LZK73_34740 (plasmid) [Neorhizobium galegae]|nr:hypothetical protein LZK73_34740 [Neorhizobium galegae]
MNANISAAIRAVPSEAKEAIVNVRGRWAFLAIGLAIAAAVIAFLNYEFSGLPRIIGDRCKYGVVLRRDIDWRDCELVVFHRPAMEEVGGSHAATADAATGGR